MVFGGVISASSAQVIGEPIPESTIVLSSLKPCRDTVTCQLPLEIRATDAFLRTHKVGLITPDPRPLSPESEVIRLNIVPQALGYLNLYRTTRSSLYRQEAEDRLHYLQQIGPDAYGGGVRAGMVGYAFLLGYQLTGNDAYRVDGLRIADDCVLQNDHDALMNGGLMCGFNLTLAYRLTNNETYRTAARGVIERTAPFQRLNGGFPHQPDDRYPITTSYTAWMATELLLMRQDDPGNDLNDVLLSQVLPFLVQRVNADGSINYQDANGSYYEDPGNMDSRYWTAEVANIALNAYAGGYRDAANRALRFLFSTELTGKNRGSYPDKYRPIYPANIWESGNPSIVRTSINFWYLTMFATMNGSWCSSQLTVPCAITPSNCSSLYQSLNQCDQGIIGTKTCLPVTTSACVDLKTTTWLKDQTCSNESYCVDDPLYGACYYVDCLRSGNKICVNGVCGGICYAVQRDEVQCDSYCNAGELCPTSSAKQQSSLKSSEISPLGASCTAVL